VFSLFFSEPGPGEFVSRGAADFTDLVRESGGSLFSLSGSNPDAPIPLPATVAKAPDLTPDSFALAELQARWIYEYTEKTRDKIKTYTQALHDQVCGFYVVQFSPAELREENKIKVEIVDPAGTARKDVQLLYPSAARAVGNRLARPAPCHPRKTLVYSPVWIE
jgi:hypothetical protein